MTSESREIKHVRSFILGGNAEFSIENLNSGNHFHYKVMRSQDDPEIYFVRYMTKKNGWMYAGYLNTGTQKYIMGRGGTQNYDSNVIKGLLYALRKGDNPLPRPMICYHHGTCGCCGRKLMDLESIERGFGPKCWTRISGVIAR